jgi:hypothetical protein
LILLLRFLKRRIDASKGTDMVEYIDGYFAKKICDVSKDNLKSTQKVQLGLLTGYQF